MTVKQAGRLLFSAFFKGVFGVINELYSKKFTVREIEKLKGESKSTVSRKLSKEDDVDE
ncbi:MAG: hypothetical protein RR678_08415 [Lachnospiraceae bacterium]